MLEALATFLLVSMIKIIGMLFKCAPSGPQKHKTKESDGLHIKYHSMHSSNTTNTTTCKKLTSDNAKQIIFLSWQ